LTGNPIGRFNRALRQTRLYHTGAGIRYKMNNLLWGVQILLAGIFLFTAAGKLFDYEQLVRVVEGRSRRQPIGVSRGQAILLGLAEVAGAIGLLIPGQVNPSHLVVVIAAAWLATIMIGARIYHARRRDPAAPTVVLFLLALLVIVGRWPR
jgi:uncharacterized membrane protein YphA (DoxX/SURF4 family)